jgi:hypothetical protein
MKNTLLLLALLPLFCSSQTVYKVKDNKTKADYKVFVTNSKYETPYRVYKVKDVKDTGYAKWFFTKDSAKANIKIRYVYNYAFADFFVYFVKHPWEAGCFDIKKRKRKK